MGESAVDDIAIPTGMVMFSSDDSPEGLHEARDYIRSQNLTADDVRLVKRAGQALVIAKRDFTRGEC
jgi:hypothetical protein